MHMRADGNILLRVTDGEAILDDLFARLDGEKRHLMPGGNVRDRGERNAIHRHGLPGGQGGQRDRHIVLRGDAKQFSHFSHSELLVHDRAHPLVKDFAQGRADGLHQTRHFA